MADWWRQLSDGITGFADQLVQQANNAQQEIEREHEQLAQQTSRQNVVLKETNIMPWNPLFLRAPIGRDREIDVESLSILEQDLMEQILSLSLFQENFITSPINAEEIKAQGLFNFNEFVPVAMRLLELDANLARLHSKLAPKMVEQDFWFHYFCRVIYLRAAIGMDGDDARSRAQSWQRTQPDIVQRAQREAPPAPSFSRPPATTSPAITPLPAAEAAAEPSEEMRKMLDELDFDMSELDLAELQEEDGFEQVQASPEGAQDLDDDAALEALIAQELADTDDD